MSQLNNSHLTPSSGFKPQNALNTRNKMMEMFLNHPYDRELEGLFNIHFFIFQIN